MLDLSAPWLSFALGQPMPVLSWAPHNGGLVTAERILWREVRNADLTEDLDVTDWLARELAQREDRRAGCFLTSRKLDAHVTATETQDGITATAVVTAGLSNAERIGTRLPQTWKVWGTINIALRLSAGLTLPARIEALSLVAEARTAAVLEAGVTLPSGAATGTGTDCIAVAAPEGHEMHCGKHTAAGHAIGRAVFEATRRAVADWQRDAARW